MAFGRRDRASGIHRLQCRRNRGSIHPITSPSQPHDKDHQSRIVVKGESPDRNRHFDESQADMTAEDPPFDQPIPLAIDGVLDLHTFHPKELRPLLEDYIAACRERGILSLRIVHGKGRGVLRERVHGVLRRHPHVRSFRLAGPHAGGWGATLVELAP